MRFLFKSNLISAQLLKRYKRFLADVRLPGGNIESTCPNPDAMTSAWRRIARSG